MALETAFSRHTRWQSFPRLCGSGAPRVIYAHRTCIETLQVLCTYAAVCNGCLAGPSQHISCAVLVWRWLFCSPGASAKSRTSSAARSHTSLAHYSSQAHRAWRWTQLSTQLPRMWVPHLLPTHDLHVRLSESCLIRYSPRASARTAGEAQLLGQWCGGGV